jgi:hypothetical protein
LTPRVLTKLSPNYNKLGELLILPSKERGKQVEKRLLPKEPLEALVMYQVKWLPKEE